MISEDLRQVISNQYREYKNYREVARLNGVSKTTVKRIVENLFIKDKKKPGPKPKIKPRQERNIKRAIQRFPIVKRELQVQRFNALAV